MKSALGVCVSRATTQSPGLRDLAEVYASNILTYSYMLQRLIRVCLETANFSENGLYYVSANVSVTTEKCQKSSFSGKRREAERGKFLFNNSSHYS